MHKCELGKSNLSDKHWTLGGEGAHQIREILALDNAGDCDKKKGRKSAQECEIKKRPASGEPTGAYFNFCPFGRVPRACDSAW